MSSVEIDSSLERIIIDELTIFKTLSESKPERMSADVIAPVMTESTAARLPVPMPSEIIIMKLPLPSKKQSYVSPHRHSPSETN